MENNEKNKILVLRLSSLGDIMLASPVFKNIKAKWPNCHIALMVKPQFAQVFSGHPDIDEIIVFKGYISTLRRIRKEHFTHLLDLHSTLRTRIISLLSGIPKKQRYNKHAVERRLYVNFKITNPALEKHTLEKYLEALKPWDIPIKYTTPQLNDWSFKPA